MPRPLFSHQMVFRTDPTAHGTPAYGWVVAPADPATLVAGQIARNAATLSATTTISIHVIDGQGTDYTEVLAAVRGGGGANQADVLLMADRTNVARFKVTGVATLAGGTIYSFTVAPIVIVGGDPAAGAWTRVNISFVATA